MKNEASAVSEDATLQAHTEGTPPSFLPTVAASQSSTEASTMKPETHTFVPFIPNVLPDVVSAVTFETPLTEEEVEGYTEGTAEEPSDILMPDSVEETITEQREDAETKVQEIPPADPADAGGAAPEEIVPDGKSA